MFSDPVKHVILVIAVICSILLVLASGCMGITAPQKTGDATTSLGTTGEQNATSGQENIDSLTGNLKMSVSGLRKTVQNPTAIRTPNSAAVQKPEISPLATPIASSNGGGTGGGSSSDPNNCGSTGKVCPKVNGAYSTCLGGKCSFTCKDFYADCNQNPGDGCETYLGVADHCGACDNICKFDHGRGDCSNGKCVLTICDAGWTDCNQNDPDGCETNILSNENCGTCGVQCGSGKVCLHGGCMIDCPNPNIVTWDGACTDPYTDPKNCGVRGHVCPNPPNAEGICEKGTCTWKCNAPHYGTDASGKYRYLIFGDCDNKATNGCETDLTMDENCGKCGNMCGSYQDCDVGKCYNWIG